MSSRIGLGFDVHAFGGDGPLVLGGERLDGHGLVGHSDADVITHAVADALLGAAGLGDLGTMFPASDDEWAGASSVALLATVAERVAADGWSIVNIDVSVAAEEPMLAPHVDAMQRNIAGAVATAATEGAVPVRISPKHAEGLGAIGRAEGIAAWAVALVGS